MEGSLVKSVLPDQISRLESKHLYFLIHLTGLRGSPSPSPLSLLPLSLSLSLSAVFWAGNSCGIQELSEAVVTYTRPA